MQRVTTIADLRRRIAAERSAGRRIALVPTMGALHPGHLELVRLAAEHADRVVVSIFVNPTQFDRPDDLGAYPRDLAGDERDLAGLGPAAPALVFAPAVDEMYPREPLTTVHVARLTDGLCGARRPGHFDGVATVVTKLLNVVAPDVAVFGRKDAQQLRVLRRVVEDLDLPVEIVDGPTVREPDGLAWSSRNRRLRGDQRRAALALPAALAAAVLAARAARSGGHAVDPRDVTTAARGPLGAATGLDVDYLEVVHPDTLEVTTAPAERLLVAVAAELGEVRLIDNVEIGHLDDEARLLDAVAVTDAEA